MDIYKQIIFSENKFNILLISLLPVSLLFGTFVSEIIIFLIIFFFLYKMVLLKNFKFLFNSIFYITVLIYCYLLFNLTISTNFDLSFNRSVYFIRFPLLAMAIAYFIKKNNFDSTIIYKVWGATIGIVIFDLYFQYFFGFNLLGFKSPAPYRLSSFLGEELKIAHLLIGFAMHVIIFNYVANKNNKIFYLLIIIYLIILLLINERSNAVKGILIITLSYLLINNIKIKEKFFVTIIFLSTIFSIIYFNDKVNQRFYNEIKKMKLDNNKVSEYIKKSNYGPYYLSGYEVFKKNPYFGSGIKTFRKVCNDVDLNKYYKNETYYKDLHLRKCNSHPHQIHIEILSELGLFGYFLFIIFFIYLFVKAFNIYIKKKNLNILCPILFVFTQYLPLLPSGSFFTNFGAIIFWINVGLIYSEIIKYE
tara:strand:- start:849 stop:2105 length:1257 start_codon:yes stop_codon:yes gene_type:complete